VLPFGRKFHNLGARFCKKGSFSFFPVRQKEAPELSFVEIKWSDLFDPPPGPNFWELGMQKSFKKSCQLCVKEFFAEKHADVGLKRKK